MEKGKSVWFKYAGEGGSWSWLPAILEDIAVDEVEGTAVEVTILEPKRFRHSAVLPVASDGLLPRHGSNFNYETMENLSELPLANEPEILKALRARHLRQLHYLQAGDLLLVTKPTESKHDKKELFSFVSRTLGANSASASHVFVLSGDSGSGKSGVAMSLLSHLASNSEAEMEKLSSLLDFWTGVRTQYCNDSTRCLRIAARNSDQWEFKISCLETSRLLLKSKDHSLFHVFHAMFAHSDPLPRWKLRSDAEHLLLSASATKKKDQAGSPASSTLNSFSPSDLDTLRSMMVQCAGMSSAQVDGLLDCVAAIVHLGDLVFVQALPDDASAEDSSGIREGAANSKDQRCSIHDRQPLECAGQLLDVSCDSLHAALTTRQVSVGGKGDQFTLPLNLDQGRQARDCLLRVVYAAIVHTLVTAINRQLAVAPVAPASKDASCAAHGNVSVLDMAGFERQPTADCLEALHANLLDDRFAQHYFATSRISHLLTASLYPTEDVRKLMSDYRERAAALSTLLEVAQPAMLATLADNAKITSTDGPALGRRLIKAVNAPAVVRHIDGFASDMLTVRHWNEAVHYSTTDFLAHNGQLAAYASACVNLLAQCAKLSAAVAEDGSNSSSFSGISGMESVRDVSQLLQSIHPTASSAAAVGKGGGKAGLQTHHVLCILPRQRAVEANYSVSTHRVVASASSTSANSAPLRSHSFYRLPSTTNLNTLITEGGGWQENLVQQQLDARAIGATLAAAHFKQLDSLSESAFWNRFRVFLSYPGQSSASGAVEARAVSWGDTRSLIAFLMQHHILTSRLFRHRSCREMIAGEQLERFATLMAEGLVRAPDEEDDPRVITSPESRALLEKCRDVVLACATEDVQRWLLKVVERKRLQKRSVAIGRIRRNSAVALHRWVEGKRAEQNRRARAVATLQRAARTFLRRIRIHYRIMQTQAMRIQRVVRTWLEARRLAKAEQDELLAYAHHIRMYAQLSQEARAEWRSRSQELLRAYPANHPIQERLIREIEALLQEKKHAEDDRVLSVSLSSLQVVVLRWATRFEKLAVTPSQPPLPRALTLTAMAAHSLCHELGEAMQPAQLLLAAQAQTICAPPSSSASSSASPLALSSLAAPAAGAALTMDHRVFGSLLRLARKLKEGAAWLAAEAANLQSSQNPAGRDLAHGMLSVAQMLALAERHYSTYAAYVIALYSDSDPHPWHEYLSSSHTQSPMTPSHAVGVSPLKSSASFYSPSVKDAGRGQQSVAKGISSAKKTLSRSPSKASQSFRLSKPQPATISHPGMKALYRDLCNGHALLPIRPIPVDLVPSSLHPLRSNEEDDGPFPLVLTSATETDSEVVLRRTRFPAHEYFVDQFASLLADRDYGPIKLLRLTGRGPEHAGERAHYTAQLIPDRQTSVLCPISQLLRDPSRCPDLPLDIDSFAAMCVAQLALCSTVSSGGNFLVQVREEGVRFLRYQADLSSLLGLFCDATTRPAVEPVAGPRHILYTCPLMAASLPAELVDRLVGSAQVHVLLAGLLRRILSQCAHCFDKLGAAGFDEEDLNDLHLPLLLPARCLRGVTQRLQAIAAQLRSNPSSTFYDLLEAIDAEESDRYRGLRSHYLAIHLETRHTTQAWLAALHEMDLSYAELLEEDMKLEDRLDLHAAYERRHIQSIADIALDFSYVFTWDALDSSQLTEMFDLLWFSDMDTLFLRAPTEEQVQLMLGEQISDALESKLALRRFGDEIEQHPRGGRHVQQLVILGLSAEEAASLENSSVVADIRQLLGILVHFVTPAEDAMLAQLH